MSKRHQPGGPPPAPPSLPTALIDSHTHLDHMADRAGVSADDEYVQAVMAQAHAAGVAQVITVGGSAAANRWAVAAAEAHRDVFAAVAVHPTEVGELSGPDAQDRYDELAALARSPRCVAVGETGLDYYWDRTDPADQRVHFRRHIELAHTVGKPLMIHDRQAHQDVLELVLTVGVPPAGVVMHSFSGDPAFAEQCLAAGFYLSFSGVATFTNAGEVRHAAIRAPRERILLETDAPFLTPHPYRGRANSPYLLGWTARGIAADRGEDAGAFAAACTANTVALYPALAGPPGGQGGLDG